MQKADKYSDSQVLNVQTALENRKSWTEDAMIKIILTLVSNYMITSPFRLKM